MRNIWVATAAVVAMTACTPGGDLGGGDPGWELNDDPFTGAESADTGGSGVDEDDFESLSISDLTSTCEADGSVDNLLVATAIEGGLTVEHSGLVTGCEVTWDATAVADTAAGTLFVTYLDSSGTTPEQDGCWCAWTVSYTLSGVPTGDYTLYAHTETATVSVP